MSQSSIQQAFELAVGHHRAGQLQQAEKLYRQILALAPDHADALHLSGVLAHQLGRHDEAIRLIQRAIAIQAAFPEACGNLGIVLAAVERYDEAIAAYRQALSLNPHIPSAQINLGIALQKKGNVNEAIAVYREALAQNPQNAEAYVNLGNALKENGDLSEAVAAYRRAIELNPRLPQARSNLGSALREAGQLDEAVTVLREALALRPGYPEALCNLGAALSDRGDIEDAMIAFRQAISINPKLPEAHHNLANAMKACGRVKEAIDGYQRAVQLRPGYVDALFNLGEVLARKGRFDEAIAACRKAIALQPNRPHAYRSLGNALKDTGQLSEAITAHRRAVELAGDNPEFGGDLLLALHYDPDHSPREIADETRRWGQRHAAASVGVTHANDRNPQRKLQVGYVSGDFRNHPVGRFLLPLLQQHDHSAFEIHCYSNSTEREDEITARLCTVANHWRNIARLNDVKAAEQIRADGIDLLVDLSGHTGASRLLLFARKPAPVQVSYLGYPNSTGLKAVDWRLTDALADPPGLADQLCVERLYRLPHTNWCYAETEESGPVEPPPSCRRDYVTFGCFNNFAKVTEPMLRLWGALLRGLPQSRLLLKSLAYQNPSVQDCVRRVLAEQDVDPQRIIFRALDPSHRQHLAAYNDVDIALDTFPYHGTTTTCDALSMGVPVISLSGLAHVSRVGVSLLTNAGYPELIASTEEEYHRIARELAMDTPRLREMRTAIRERLRKSAIMNAPQFATDVEEAFRRMWRDWCRSASG